YPYVALEASLAHVIEEAYGRKARGDAFFVGAQCPPEVLAKLGIDASGEPLGPESGAPDGLDAERPTRALGVVVEDEVEQLSVRDDIEEGDLGTIAEEDSVVGRVTEPPLKPESSLPVPPEGAKTILVVDDEVDIRRMLTRLLARSGYRVIEADRGVA